MTLVVGLKIAWNIYFKWDRHDQSSKNFSQLHDPTHSPLSYVCILMDQPPPAPPPPPPAEVGKKFSTKLSLDAEVQNSAFLNLSNVDLCCNSVDLTFNFKRE